MTSAADSESDFARRLTALLILAGAAACAAVAGYLLIRGRAGSPLFAASIAACAVTSALFLIPLAARVKVVLILASMAVAVFLANGVLAFAGLLLPRASEDETRPHPAAAAAAGAAFDPRSRLEVLLDHRQQGQGAYPVFFPYLLAWHGLPEAFEAGGRPILPLGGVSGVVTISCNESGEYLVYRSDEHGFHNPAGLYRPGEVEIAVIGDSFVLGKCVPSDANAVAWLRRGRPDAGAVLGFGAGGNGPLFDFALLREYAEPLEARHVLWFHYEGNDVRNLKKEMRSPVLVDYLEPGHTQGLIGRQGEIDRLLRSWLEEQIAKARREAASDAPPSRSSWRGLPADLLLLRSLRGALDLGVDDSPEPADDEALEWLNRILDTADESVSTWGGRLSVVYLPAWCRFAEDGCGEELYREEVLETLDRLEIPTIDLVPVFAAHPDPLSLFPFRVKGHYTEEGYRLVADTVLNHLDGPGSETR